MTSKNQITLPKSMVGHVSSAEYFEVTTRGGSIVLTPVRVSRAASVRAKLDELNISERDIADAVKWARRS